MSNLSVFAQMIATHCGLGDTLDIGCGEGFLVGELLNIGINAKGVDVSKALIKRANGHFTDRFQQATAVSLPFENEEFYTIVSTNYLEYLTPNDVKKALHEIYRVTRRFVFLQVATIQGKNEHLRLTVEKREWWEQCCFETGFRKHPNYYRVNDYEALNVEGEQIYIFLEKIPRIIRDKYPIKALAKERNLHMDMLREVGERSDAHVIRYKWAATFVRQGDRVLDAACGLGYGSYILTELSKAKSVIGIDGSDYAIDYARENFTDSPNKINFISAYIPEYLSAFESGYFDVIVSFETLEHVEYPEKLLNEFDRVLSPGGRIIVSVPNDWSDESGNDPNPFHLHVYTLEKLREQIKKHFMPEAIVQQIATGCKLTKAWNSWQKMPRTFKAISVNCNNPPPSEWWLMVGIKNPVLAALPYRESVYGYSSPPEYLLQFEKAYKNPWLVRSMLEFHFRARDVDVLCDIAQQVLKHEKEEVTADRGAALAVLGYQLLANGQATNADVEKFIEQLAPYTSSPFVSPHLQRFHVSLAFLNAQLLKKVGKFDSALDLLQRVTHADVNNFSPTLGTKIVDAAFDAGLLEVSRENIPSARAYWKTGIERAYSLLSSSMVEFIGDIENPHEFPTIVAVEFLDSAVRCIKALRITAKDSFVPVGRLYELTKENWKCMLEERWITIQSQAQMLEDRWAIMQSMEAMIRDRDEIIAKHKQKKSLLKVLLNRAKFNEELLSLQSLPNDAEVPFRDLAFSLYLFTARLYRAAMLKGVKDLFFFAREGQSLKTMFDFYQSLSNSKSHIRTHYLRLSRRSTFLLSLGPLAEENFEVLFRQYHRISIMDFLRSLDLEEYALELASELKVPEFAFTKISENLTADALFQSLLKRSRFGSIYDAERVARGNAFEQYINSFFEERKSSNLLHVVDVGWKGSIQDNLYNWFSRRQRKAVQIEGYYLGLVATGGMSDANCKTGLLFSNVGGRTPGFHIFNENRSLFEIVLHADHGSARRYFVDSDGSPKVMEDQFIESEMITKKIRPISHPITVFFRQIAVANSTRQLSDTDLLELTKKKHARMVFRPSKNEIAWVSSVSHIENFGIFEASFFGVPKKDWSILDQMRFTWSVFRRRRPSELGFWPWLSMRTYGLAGLSSLYAFIRRRQSR